MKKIFFVFLGAAIPCVGFKLTSVKLTNYPN